MSLQDAKDVLVGNKKADEVTPPVTQSAQPVQPLQREEIVKPTAIIMEWESPERMFKKQPREFFRRIAVIISFFVLLLLFIKEFLVIAVLGVVFFVTYVFYTVPPRTVRHQVTNNGFNFGDEHFYKWKDLVSFYFETKNSVTLLILNTVDVLPGRLYVILAPTVDRAKLQAELNQHISIEENPEKNMYEDWMNKITSKLNTK